MKDVTVIIPSRESAFIRKERKLPACPHCGRIGEFIVHGQMSGPADFIYDEDGAYSEMNMDKMYLRHFSSVVRCGECGKIRRDVYIHDRTEIRLVI
jgi:hypothetical protein